MSETSSQITDSSGVTRTATGEIADKSPSMETSSTTTNNQTEQSTQNTSQESKTKTESSFLNEEGKTKTETETTPALDKDGKPVKVETGAPEKYADFKLPEGYTLPDELKADVTGMFKNWNLTQDQAQQAVDFYTQHTKEAMDAPYQMYLETRKGWRDEIASDPVIGPKQAVVKTEIGRAINSLGDPQMIADFRKALDITGIGDHPAFVKAFYAFAQRINEGSPVLGRNASPHGQVDPSKSGDKPSAAQAMYPNLPSAQRG